jgi:hypothetical protein
VRVVPGHIEPAEEIWQWAPKEARDPNMTHQKQMQAMAEKQAEYVKQLQVDHERRAACRAQVAATR